MVLAQSLFKLLKLRNTHTRLDVLAPAWTLPLLACMPEVDQSIAVSFVHGRLDLGERLRMGRALRAANYDQAIILPNSLKSAIVPFVARARTRTGFIGEWRFGLLNDARRLAKDKLPRTVDRFVALGLNRDDALPDIPSPRLVVDNEKVRAVLARFHPASLASPVLGLCPGAEFGPAKRWPAEYFAEVAKAGLAKGWEVWLFGSGKDRLDTAAVQSQTQNRCLDLAGQTTLEEAIQLLSVTTAVVSNDSGLMHVAAALERPVVALYGSSDPKHTPPMSERAKVLYLGLSCSPCFKRHCPLGHLNCLRQLRPDQVLAALKE